MRKSFPLSPRLQAIADEIPQGAAVADIGSDHAYLPVYLTQKHRVCRAIASDLNAAPLERGRKIAQEAEVSGDIEFRRCDGLAAFTSGDASHYVIAGMGGETIAAILDQAQWLKKEPVELILQPMTKVEYLRYWLSLHGYRFVKEFLVREGNQLYLVFRVIPGSSGGLRMDEIYGGVLLGNDPLLPLYLERQIEKLLSIAEGLSHSAAEQERQRAEKYRLLAEQLKLREDTYDIGDRDRTESVELGPQGISF